MIPYCHVCGAVIWEHPYATIHDIYVCKQCEMKIKAIESMISIKEKYDEDFENGKQVDSRS